MISAVYDACVLFSGALRDLLMNIAVSRVVRAYWSDDIHDEWIRSLLKNRPGLSRERLEQTRRQMNEHAEGSLITGYEHLIPTLWLPDPNDRHVLAVAIRSGAKLIVTYNQDDFPAKVLASYSIKAVSPDDFVFELLRNNPNEILFAVKFHRASLTRPAKTVAEYLATLEKQGLSKTVAFLRNHAAEL